MDSRPADSPPRTIAEALRTTAKLIWDESDTFTRRHLAFSFVLLLIGSVLSAAYPVVYKLTIDKFSGQAAAALYLGPALLVAGLVITNYLRGLSMTLRELVHGRGVQRLDRLISNRL